MSSFQSINSEEDTLKNDDQAYQIPYQGDKPLHQIKRSLYSNSNPKNQRLQNSSDSSLDDHIDEESPTSKLERKNQEKKQSAEIKVHMIKEFKDFILQQQQNYEGEEDEILIPKDHKPELQQKNRISQGKNTKLLNQTSINIGEDNLLKPSSIQNTKIERRDGNQSSASFDGIGTPKLKRQSSIAQQMQKRLKITHKSKEQLFNEKLRMFKGISTFVETKDFLQNLNVLNKRKLAEELQKNFQLNQKFEVIKRQSQLFKQQIMEEEVTHEEDAKKEKQIQLKYNKEDPKFDKKLHDLLNVAQTALLGSHIPRNHQNIQFAAKVFESVQQKLAKSQVVKAYEQSDEDHFFYKLREELNSEKTNEKSLEQTLQQKNNQIKKAKEQQILDELYTNTELVGQLSSTQIKEFVNMRLQQELKSNTESGVGQTSKIEQCLKSLNINPYKSLEAKTQYEEYVEKANQIRNTLNQLNENFFNKKWANALIKRKKEKERLRAEILSKIQNAEIAESKMDILFPGKKKMNNVKSRVDSNLDILEKGGHNVYQNDEDSPKKKDEGEGTKHLKKINSIQSKTNIITGESTREIIMNSNQSIDIPRKQRILGGISSQKIPSSTKIEKPKISEEKEFSSFFSPKTQNIPQKQQVTDSTFISNDNNNTHNNNINNVSINQGNSYYLNSKKSPHLLSTFQSNKQYLLSRKTINSFEQASTENYSQLSSQKNSLHSLPSKQLSFSNSLVTHTPQNGKIYRHNATRSFGQISSIHQNETEDEIKGRLNLNNFHKTQQFHFQKRQTLGNSKTLSALPHLSLDQKNKEGSASQNEQYFIENNIQKEKLNVLLNKLEEQKRNQRTDKKQLKKDLESISSHCDEALNKLKGDSMGSISKVLDLEFFNFSKKPNLFPSQTNIKNFLNRPN